MHAKEASKLAEHFFNLHVSGSPFVIANVWDAASARVFETAGFPALATSSAAMAWTLGYADGENVNKDELFAAIGRIARAIRVPLSADLEAGFGSSSEQVANTCERAVATGVVGVNLEDFDAANGELFPVETAVERIRAFRERADALGKRMFINARTDVILRAVGPMETRARVAVERLRAYVAAGADGAFVPGLTDAATIAEIARAVPAPLNVLLAPGSPSRDELARCGVARISIGSSPMSRVLGVLRDIAEDLRADKFTYLDDLNLAYRDCNALFRKSDELN